MASTLPDTWFEGFEARDFEVNGTSIFARFGGNAQGPTLLLLHGFPQSHVMWHRVVQVLQASYFLVLPDLRGYGDSSKVPGLPDHSNYSKRNMAQDAVAVMDALGRDNFFLCGHDRGGRVAHRLALDHSARVDKLCVIDIAPTLDMYNATNMAFASAYYHWFHLIQPSPLPETMIGGNALAYLHAKLGGWGSSGLGYIEPEALIEYERCFCTPEAIHAACEDYRASAGIDLVHDRESRARGDKISCDTQVLWGQRGVVHKLFEPLALWQAQCAGIVSGHAMPAGHFIPEELPLQTADALIQFFGSSLP
ncbi:MAG: alpha/beta hydrolase [Polaromonas sp.]|uniref:alpha/beta fold hydrolase n=1 Tax=Polaromonas sp. TaxID=1869339 RepID=UPI002731686E|nr:alpha/beta hydrolase [Polaromonas sp.]MDP1740051.1 alpha/beta hydrolase [Polaromonas sp.]MDP1954604.1 alpha/beta hydrolase [Polaromonas sp.]MDP3752295.1 alpha/beta hydrolase [Polaromonas sp.]